MVERLLDIRTGKILARSIAASMEVSLPTREVDS